MGDSRDDPRYKALRQAAQRTAQAASVADRLAAKTSGYDGTGKYDGDPLRNELKKLCGGDDDKAAKMYQEALRKAGVSGGPMSRLMRRAFNR